MNSYQEDIKKIIERLERIEKVVFSAKVSRASKPTAAKSVSIPELIRNTTFRSGQQRVAVLVGYMEKIEGKPQIVMADIKDAWRRAKFNGNFANVFVSRAVKDALIADYGGDGNYVLTQTGERFWEEQLAAQ